MVVDTLFLNKFKSEIAHASLAVAFMVLLKGAGNMISHESQSSRIVAWGLSHLASLPFL